VSDAHNLDNNNELQDFVKEALRQIKDGSSGHKIYDPVEFEVAIAKTTTANGKIGIKVLGVGGVDGGGELKTESISKMKFKVHIKNPEDFVGGVTTGQNMLEDGEYNPDPYE
jgi:hypothetical protein